MINMLGSLSLSFFTQDIVNAVLGLQHVGWIFTVFGLSHLTSTWMTSQLVLICHRTKIICKFEVNEKKPPLHL